MGDNGDKIIEQARVNMIAGCNDTGAPPAYCDCMWQQFSMSYTRDELIKFGRGELEIDQTRVQQLATNCAQTIPASMSAS